MDTITRREIIRGGASLAVASAFGGCITGKTAEAEQSLVTAEEDAVLDLWQGETDLAEANVYVQYLKDGQTRGEKNG